MSPCKRMKLDTYLTSYTKINSEKAYVNVSPETRIPRRIHRGKVLHISLGNDFLDMKPKAYARKAKIQKWDYTKLKTFCTAKEIINRMKRQPTEWEKKKSSHISDKSLISKIHKKLLNSTTKKQMDEALE